jgi:hypothetical protein
MTPMRRVAGLGIRAGVWLAAAVTLLCAPARAQQPDAPKPNLTPRGLPTRFPDKPSIAPTSTIPIEALGFAAPGALYLGERNSLVSLDFIDEDKLLFTFRVPALLHRKPGSKGDADQREIRAVVLAVGGGMVLAESNWLLHDRARYLWMLRDGHFLLRDRNSLVEGDATLKLSPLLDFPGPLLSIELDPTQQFLVSNSREPVQVATKQDSPSPADPAPTGVDNDEASGADAPDLVLRIMQRNSGEVMLVTRVRSMVHVPLNDQGYLGSLRGNGMDWRLDMNFFGGGNRLIGAVKSACMPDVSFVSASEVLAAACADSGNDALVAMTTNGDKLWIDLVPDRQVWPILTVAPNGSRIARETLFVTHSISSFAPLGDDDIKGQWVQVLDAATGKVAFETPVTPILDAGGNVAISPSGKRVAILKDNVIQVFELPAPPRLPETEPSHR